MAKLNISIYMYIEFQNLSKLIKNCQVCVMFAVKLKRFYFFRFSVIF